MKSLADTTLTLGYPDGSAAEDTLLMGGEAVMKAHWGCSCCDRPATDMDTAIITRAAACWNSLRGITDPEKAVQAARLFIFQIANGELPGVSIGPRQQEIARHVLALLTVPAGAPTEAAR